MTPVVRNRLRVLIDSVYEIIQNEELIPKEFEYLNSGIINLINADYFLSHCHLSHTKAKEIFCLHNR